MNTYEIENIFDDLKRGRICETEAEWDLKRIVGSSCVRDRIGKIVRDTAYGRYDSFDARRKVEELDTECRRRRRLEEEQQEW